MFSFRSLCYLLAASTIFSGTALAQSKVVLRDASHKMTSIVFNFPQSWRGAGAVIWTPESKLDGNVCSRRFTIINDKKDLRAAYCSSIEIPIKKMSDDALVLTNILAPVLSKYYSVSAENIKLKKAYMTNIPAEVKASLKNRDSLRSGLGEKIGHKTSLLTMIYTGTKDGKTVDLLSSCIVHQRDCLELKSDVHEATATFHDIFMICGGEKAIKEALPRLRKSMIRPQYNDAWLDLLISTKANVYYGMKNLDPAAMPMLRKEATKIFIASVNTVITGMMNCYNALNSES